MFLPTVAVIRIKYIVMSLKSLIKLQKILFEKKSQKPHEKPTKNDFYVFQISSIEMRKNQLLEIHDNAPTESYT